MEHLNFNPVKFVRELHRVLKPGGRACITVPNRASFQNLAALVFARGEGHLIGSYFACEDYAGDPMLAYQGFHWREYTPSELRMLFADAGFRIESCDTFTPFQAHPGKPSIGRRIARVMATLGTHALPRFGQNVSLVAIR